MSEREIAVGLLAVENGQLKIWPASEGEPDPVLVPNNSVQVMVSGKHCETETPIKPEDEVVITPLSDTKAGSCTIKISDDILAAIVSIEPGGRVTRRLRDAEATVRLVIAVDEEWTPMPALSVDDLRAKLRAAGVVYGIQVALVARAASSLTPRDFLVAEGTAPLPGIDAKVEEFFDAEARTALVATDDEIVDFKERFAFTGVMPGQVLARVIPPINGTPGRGVNGDHIPPPLPKGIQLVAGQGVSWQEGPDALIAMKQGRPVATPGRGTYKVHIVPEMDVRGDVDLRTGNVSFLGDVSVSADVSSGFSVWSGANVRINGVVDHAFVQAMGSVSVRQNVMSSQLRVGPPVAFVRSVAQLLDELSGDVARLSASALALRQSLSANRLHLAHQLVASMFDKKDGGFRGRVALLVAEMSKLDKRLVHLLGDDLFGILNGFLRFTERGSITEAHIKELTDAFSTLKDRLSLLTTPEKAYIVARHIVGSSLLCTGDILVQGGCFNSKLQAGGRVEVLGVFRGGELRAGGDVKVRELGAQSGVNTQVFCQPLAKITVGTVWENCVVNFGLLTHTFHAERRRVTIGVERGKVVVSG